MLKSAHYYFYSYKCETEAQRGMSLDQSRLAGEWRSRDSNPSPADFLTHVAGPTLRASRRVE